MKKLNMVLMSLMVLTLTACGSGGGGDTGGGGGGGGGGGTGGSATFENLNSGSSSSQCVKNGALSSNYAVPKTSSSCTAAGGSWTSHSVTIPDTCRLGGEDFLVIGGGSASGSHITACTDAGGTFVATTTSSQNYCSGYTPMTCSQAGGTTIVVDSITGDISQSSVNLITGSNTISSDSNLTFLAHGSYDSLSVTEAPVYFSMHTKIVYLGSNFWEATIAKATGSSFSNYYGYNTDAPSFTVTLLVATGVRVVVDTATLYITR